MNKSLYNVKKRDYLGIYIRKNAATVVLLDSHSAGGKKIKGCFSVCLEDQAQTESKTQAASLVEMIVGKCEEKIPSYKDCEVAIALDCAMFMQHSVHSAFGDVKQIASTVRFDTEEVLAADVSNVAIAFQVTSSDDDGSELGVFTAEKTLLREILHALQANGIDPVTAEPDVTSLARFVEQNTKQAEGETSLFAFMSESNGYFIAADSAQKAKSMRTFLVSARQDRTALLGRELPLTMALPGVENVNRLEIFDSADSVDCAAIGQSLGIESRRVDLAGMAEVDEQDLSECANSVDFAIAYGAGLANSQADKTVNFRSDFMPYQGKKQRVEKTLKYAGVSATILFIALGLFLQVQLNQKNKPRKELRKVFAKDYLAVILNARKMPGKLKEATRRLGSESRRIESVKKGLISATGQQSISSKLTGVLDAFNKSAKKTKLQINRISIAAKSIRIEGSTSSQKSTLKLYDALKKSGFEIDSSKTDPKGGRGNFNISIVPKKE
ncbi:type II secretion system protein GspL [Planctomycetota bacterium]